MARRKSPAQIAAAKKNLVKARAARSRTKGSAKSAAIKSLTTAQKKARSNRSLLRPSDKRAGHSSALTLTAKERRGRRREKLNDRLIATERSVYLGGTKRRKAAQKRYNAKVAARKAADVTKSPLGRHKGPSGKISAKSVAAVTRTKIKTPAKGFGTSEGGRARKRYLKEMGA